MLQVLDFFDITTFVFWLGAEELRPSCAKFGYLVSIVGSLALSSSRFHIVCLAQD